MLIADSYEKMSKLAAEDLVVITQSLQHPLISPASGDSPAGLYKELVNRVNKNQIDTSNWHFVALDEWVGLNGNDEGSCRYHLNKQLFEPLNIPADKIRFFDGRSEDLNAECEKVETYIQQHTGIDIAIVGIGLNGHIGMNEPGTRASSRSHVGPLDPLTAQVGQKYFKEERELTEGITLGLANILEAKNIFLLISGRKKAEIVQQMLEGEISETLPATLLRSHTGLRIYLDKEAAALIDQDLYGK
jgi:galactosamine-6-phosphate isomerase